MRENEKSNARIQRIDNISRIKILLQKKISIIIYSRFI